MNVRIENIDAGKLWQLGKITVPVSKRQAVKIARNLKRNVNPLFCDHCHWWKSRFETVCSIFPHLQIAVMLEERYELVVIMNFRQPDPDDDLNYTLPQPNMPTDDDILDAAFVLRKLLALGE